MKGPVTAPPAPADKTADKTVDKVPTYDAATTTPQRRKLKLSTRIALAVILVLALVVGGVFATSYFLNTRNFVSTDNAQVDGNKIPINAPTSGTLVDWSATQGAVLRKDQRVGRVEIRGGFVQPKMSIRAPADGTVAVDNGVRGGFVAAGAQLAIAYDLDKVFITARVDETDIKAVRPGQQVDMTVDAFPDTPLSGYVHEIQGGASGQFSAFPEANTSGNFQKVAQVIPVKVALEDRRGLALVPGMNVTVHIHKRVTSTSESHPQAER
ncbi:MAG TPA: efflux RND transporter periplasmic adaptor subunit [Pseudonocardiaceae bacterium]|jgi:multidrug resistance efflux pump|nr:efflux RND transporter periplasmic adaptor subunit [Pseudonocardiaceae bacterium]